MADAYAPRGVQMALLYTREAHPGEHYPAHRNFEQKLAHARAFTETFGIRRPVLVDDLEGTIHQAYGLLPNMTYIVGTNGRVLYRSDWTDPHSIGAALDYLLHEGELRRTGIAPAPFYSELLGHRPIDRAAFMEGLERAGPRAVKEFVAATEATRGPMAARPLRQWQQAARARDAHRKGRPAGERAARRPPKLPDGNI